MPSPAKAGSITHIEGAADTAAFVFKTIADPFAGRINLFRVLQGSVRPEQTLVDARTHAKERMGSPLPAGQGAHRSAGVRPGDIGAVAKLKEVQTGDLLLDKEVETDVPEIGFPEPVMSFAITPKSKGDEEKVAQAIRRLGEEDPDALHRDQQTGRRSSGMSQMHVEVALERAKRRFGVDVELHPPRVPYLETIRKESRLHARYKKQPAAAGIGDCTIVLEPIEGNVGYEFVDKIVGGVIPQSFRPAVDKGIQEAMHHARAGRSAGAGNPRAARRRLLPHGRLLRDGVQDRRLDGVQGGVHQGGAGAARADHGARGHRPDEAVGAVNGDLNSRRGRCTGWSRRR